ncbi:MAG: discoidin domain-containing protein, partial [Candidatus Sericytochromatia bacterium]
PQPLQPYTPPAAQQAEGDALLRQLQLPADQQAYPDGRSYRVQAVGELTVTGTIADSQIAGLEKERLADNNLATQWVNGGWRNETAWAGVQLSTIHSIAAVQIKTGPTASGASYDIQVSDDGFNWSTKLANQTNSSWNMERKAMPAGTTGSYVRIFWRNSQSSPQAHFAIYELAVLGETTGNATPAPYPSTTPPPSGTGSIIGTRVDSEASGLSKARLVDQSPSTEWANGGYRNPTAWAVVELSSRMAISRIRLKTGPTAAGASYDVQTSEDGSSWTTRLANQTNSSWNMEAKSLPSGSAGKFVRIFWRNSQSSPQNRFSIFEIEIEGASSGGGWTPAPTPTSAPSSTPQPSPSAGSGDASSYYPDLRAIPPDNLWLESTSSGRKIRFSNAIPNVGRGVFRVRGRNDWGAGVTYATQEIVDGGGRVVATHSAGTFEFHPGHDHIHLADAARYQLRSGSPTGTVVRMGDKVSFCMMDSYPYLSGAPAATFRACEGDVQGISRGWADLYASNLPGQELDVTTLAAGEYYLVSTTDPFNRFIDLNRGNNTAWVKVYLDARNGVLRRLDTSD